MKKMRIAPKPSKNYCLLMAHYYCVRDCENLMWDWLVVWAFHEMYMEAYT
jgi:hypothetical protein